MPILFRSATISGLEHTREGVKGAETSCDADLIGRLRGMTEQLFGIVEAQTIDVGAEVGTTLAEPSRHIGTVGAYGTREFDDGEVGVGEVTFGKTELWDGHVEHLHHYIERRVRRGRFTLLHVVVLRFEHTDVAKGDDDTYKAEDDVRNEQGTEQEQDQKGLLPGRAFVITFQP